jgi:PST family polysaccharide transporter
MEAAMSEPGDDGERTDLTRTVVRGVGLSTAGHLLTRAISLGQYLVLARLAAPHEFGQLAAGSIVVGAAALVSESGMLAALVQRRDRLDEAASTALVATVAGGVLLSLVALAAAPLLGAFFHSPTIGRVAAVMSATVLVNQISIVPDAILQRRFSFLRRVALEPIGTVIGAGVAIAATAAGYGVWGLVAGIYAGAVTQAVLAWAFVDWRPRRSQVSFAMWRELSAFGRHVILSQGIWRANSEGRTAIVGKGLGAGPLGQYALAFRLGIQPIEVLVNGVSYVLMPALVRVADDAARFRAAVLRALSSLVLVATPLSLLLVPFGEPATVLLFGPEWRPAGNALAWMCGFSIGGAVGSVASETWKAAGRPNWLPRMSATATLCALLLTALFLPFHLEGAAAALSVSELIGATVSVVGVARVTGTPIAAITRGFVAPAIGGVALVAATWPLRKSVDPAAYGHAAGLPLLVGEALVGLAVYAAVVAALRPADAARALTLVRGWSRRGSPAPLPPEAVSQLP